MLFFALFTALSALLIQVVATPLPMHRPIALYSNPRSALYRRAPPKFEIPLDLVESSQRKEVLDKMKEHYETKATDAQKRARLASANSRWSRHVPGRDYMSFDYHEGDTTDSPVIGHSADIYRDKPVPKIRFLNVINNYQEEMKVEAAKRYNDLTQDKADRVKSMKLWGDWHLEGGIREKTKLTFHSTLNPTTGRVIGDPMTIHRPLTLHIPHIHLQDRFNIDQLSHAGLPHIPSNNQIQPHPNNPSSHREPVQSSNPVTLSQQVPQVGPSSKLGGSPHPNQQGAELSPEIWHILNTDPVYSYPWNPRQQSP